MATWLIAFLFAVGGATWVYTKIMRTSGNNSQSSIAVSVLAGVFIFLVLWSVLSMFA